MKKKILIFIITYKAKFRILKVYQQLPLRELKKYKINILISDDASRDETIKYIKKIKNRIVIKTFNKKNLGYGGNIKKCLKYAKQKKYDYAIMLHGDGQYHPKYLPFMLSKFRDKKVYAVTGSRMINRKNALLGKMPFYKFVGNIFLTFLTNVITKKKFTDCHSGFWAYRLSMFNKIKLSKITDSFNFDQQVRLSCIQNSLKISEIPIKTIYGSERSSIHLVYAIRYVFELFKYIIK